MGKFGSRGANYNPALGGSKKRLSSFSVGQKGFSFTFAHNWNDWKTKVEYEKQRVADETAAFVSNAIAHVGREAIKRCPHYSGSLERAIRVSVPDITSLKSRGRVTASVGILSSWHSKAYDDFLRKLSEKTGVAYPTSSPQLAAFIHDMYDQFIGYTENGLKRKRRKEAIVGVRVGSHFLSRAWYDSSTSNHIIEQFARRLRFGLSYDTTVVRSQDDINAELSQFASSLDVLDEDDIEG